jgi:hypothetical protein
MSIEDDKKEIQKIHKIGKSTYTDKNLKDLIEDMHFIPYGVVILNAFGLITWISLWYKNKSALNSGLLFFYYNDCVNYHCK